MLGAILSIAILSTEKAALFPAKSVAFNSRV